MTDDIINDAAPETFGNSVFYQEWFDLILDDAFITVWFSVQEHEKKMSDPTYRKIFK
jgi:hypothetical protein